MMNDNAQYDDVVQELELPEVLFVDDEEEMLYEYQELLEFEGVASQICADPVRAVQMVLDQPSIRVVVTDFWMRKLDGVGLINQLRASLPPERSVKFIILTGDVNPVLDGCKDVHLLLKPLDTCALTGIIHSENHRNGSD